MSADTLLRLCLTEGKAKQGIDIRFRPGAAPGESLRALSITLFVLPVSVRDGHPEIPTTGSTKRIAMPLKDDGATTVWNMHLKFGKMFFTYASLRCEIELVEFEPPVVESY